MAKKTTTQTTTQTPKTPTKKASKKASAVPAVDKVTLPVEAPTVEAVTPQAPVFTLPEGFKPTVYLGKESAKGQPLKECWSVTQGHPSEGCRGFVIGDTVHNCVPCWNSMRTPERAAFYAWDKINKAYGKHIRLTQRLEEEAKQAKENQAREKALAKAEAQAKKAHDALMSTQDQAILDDLAEVA